MINLRAMALGFLCLSAAIFFALFFYFAVKEIRNRDTSWHLVESHCVLKERTYVPSNGRVSHKYITIWDCGDYGIKIFYKKHLFTFAKENEEALLYENENGYLDILLKEK